jgi:hypothetical protein
MGKKERLKRKRQWDDGQKKTGETREEKRK